MFSGYNITTLPNLWVIETPPYQESWHQFVLTGELDVREIGPYLYVSHLWLWTLSADAEVWLIIHTADFINHAVFYDKTHFLGRTSPFVDKR